MVKLEVAAQCQHLQVDFLGKAVTVVLVRKQNLSRDASSLWGSKMAKDMEERCRVFCCVAQFCGLELTGNGRSGHHKCLGRCRVGIVEKL
jgi:hypothetical protein